MTRQNLSRRRFLQSTAAGVSTLALGVAQGAQSRRTEGILAYNRRTDLCDRLFVMDTWFWKNGLSIPQQDQLLRQVGVRRTSESRAKWKKFPKVLETLDRDGVELVAVYAPLVIDSEKLPAYVSDFMARLKGRDTLVWFTLSSKKYSRPDAAGHKMAVRLMRQAADAAQQAGLQISIYPHFGSWIERTDQASHLANETQSDRVGCTFNLYHWLKVEGPNDLDAKARAVLPKLNCITINGSRRNASELKVEAGILPLGEGDYDVEAFVKTFVRLGYTGPIGLQGYGIGGDIQVKLDNSLKEWRTYCKRTKNL